MNKIVLELDLDDEGSRIDKLIAEKMDDYSRSYIQKLISEELVLANNKVIKSNYKVKATDVIDIMIPDATPLDIKAEAIPLDIVYEDDDVILINKGKGMVVHPAPGHYSGTIVNGLMYHCKDNLSGINGVLRPGIVHRIDKDTTGIIIACKNDKAHQCIANQLQVHSITRVYEAICYNSFNVTEGTVDTPIGRNPNDRKLRMVNGTGAKNAVTHYKVIENFKDFSHIQCRLETGRTHQIRVHMASIRHPLLGDEMYCKAKSPFKLEGQTLHARVFGFVHPTTNEYMEFEAPLPDYFEEILRKLK